MAGRVTLAESTDWVTKPDGSNIMPSDSRGQQELVMRKSTLNTQDLIIREKPVSQFIMPPLYLVPPPPLPVVIREWGLWHTFPVDAPNTLIFTPLWKPPNRPQGPPCWQSNGIYIKTAPATELEPLGLALGFEDSAFLVRLTKISPTILSPK